MFGSNTQPIALSPIDRTQATEDYDHWAHSISAFEHSLAVSPFTSKFDAFLKGNYTMTSDEAAGYALFNGKGNCNSCHLDGKGTTLTSGQMDTSTAADVTPVFTCFGSANEGLPKNPRVAFYYETTPDSLGFTPNPGGFTYTDDGLGTFLRSGFGSAPNPNQLDAVCPNGRRPDASGYGTGCRHGTAAVFHHRGTGPLFPKGILPQWLHQEPETTRPLLQYARRIPIPR